MLSLPPSRQPARSLCWTPCLLAAVSLLGPATVHSDDLALRRPELPAGADQHDHPIDRLLQPYLERHRAPSLELAPDEVFARRVYLDCIGLPPSPEELEAFAADATPDKRARLIDRLLADRPRYAEHWLTFWNDALRNDYRGTGYIDGGRKQITSWLYGALEANMPFDQFARELINPTPESEGFVKGIVWRGVVNASQTPQVQAAQSISQVFLGINLKCASCHDSFINEWKLADAYGLAAIFADDPLEVHRCDKPTGEIAQIKFLYPQLGAVDPAAPRGERLRQLAELVTSPTNGRFARTIVNRLWARFLGRGLVEPVDQMDDAPWNADLLDWLAADLVDHGYDLKHAMRRIMTSRAYQAPTVNGSEGARGDYVFRGPAVRRMTAEQFLDSLSALTGVWQTSPTALIEPLTSSARDQNEDHQFLKFASGVVNAGATEVDVDIKGTTSLWLIVSQGLQGGDFDWADWAEPRLVGPKGEKRLTELTWSSATSGHEQPKVDVNVVGQPMRLAGRDIPYGIGTHADSVIVYSLPAGYTRFRASVGPDDGATSQSQAGHEMEFLVLTDVTLRAAQVAADPLMVALGRPNREQIVTGRPSAATTLQALELTNGPTLDQLLRQGAQRWLSGDRSTGQRVSQIYRQALGREPNAAEAQEAAALVGSPATAEGLADLLWALAMLPEFQLIY